MKTSEIFKKAKRKLWDGSGYFEPLGKNRFICHAIRDAFGWGDRAQRAINIIMSRLVKYAAVECWLKMEHNISNPGNGNVGYLEYVRKVQDVRRRWLDSLIAEYEAKGD